MSEDVVLDRVHSGIRQIEYALRRSNRKSLAISVEPDASISVIALINTTLEAIREQVKKHFNCITWQQVDFANHPQTNKAKEYVSGESFWFLGKQYILKVKNTDRNLVYLSDNYLIIEINSEFTHQNAKSLIEK
jgi:predicted metal-dependent hydrolase